MFVSAREGYQPEASASYPTMPTIEIQPQKFSAGGEHSPVHRAGMPCRANAGSRDLILLRTSNNIFQLTICLAVGPTCSWKR